MKLKSSEEKILSYPYVDYEHSSEVALVKTIEEQALYQGNDTKINITQLT